MKRRTVVGAIAPLSLAGCLRLQEDAGVDDGSDDTGGGGGGDDPGSGSDDDPGDELSYPTGLSDDGISTVLADAHRNAVTQQGAAVDIRREELSHAHDGFHWRLDVDGDEALGEIDWTNTPTVTMHFASHSGYWRGRVGGEPTYGRHRRGNRSDLGFAMRTDELQAVLRAADWDRPEADEDAGVFRVSTDAIDDERLLIDTVDGESLESLSGSCTVDGEGIIRELDVEYEFIYQDQLFLNRFTIRSEDIGAVSVSDPEWFDTAVDRAPEMTATLVEDGQFVELSHEGGNPISSQADIAIDGEVEGDLGGVQLTQPIEAGETVYLYIEDGAAQSAREEIPAGASPTPFEGMVALWALFGMEYFFVET